MSMMMPDPGAASGLPTPPGGDPSGLPPMDAANAGPLPGQDGIGGLLAALQGDQGGPPGAAPPGGDTGPSVDEMGPIEHIQEAMKHLMMAMAKDEDEDRGHGITKGMGALQGILAGEQKKNSQLQAIGG